MRCKMSIMIAWPAVQSQTLARGLGIARVPASQKCISSSAIHYI